MKNPNTRNLDAIAAQFRNSAGAIVPKKDRKQRRSERKKALRDEQAVDESDSDK